jgi:hypothetical protein
MRRTRLAVAAAALLLAACNEPFAARDELIVTVLESKVSCFGDGFTECLQVIVPGEGTPQIFYSAIEGFSFEPGVRQRLRILRYTLKDTAADGGIYRYELVQVLAKVRVLVPALDGAAR